MLPCESWHLLHCLQQSGLQTVPGSGGKDQSTATSPSGIQGEAVMYYPASGYSPPYYYNYSSSGEYLAPIAYVLMPFGYTSSNTCRFRHVSALMVDL